jgi:peroxiredoxin
VAAVLVGVHLWSTRAAIDGPVPAFAAELLDGRRVGLEDYRGRPLLVHFWATWCPVCRLEEGTIDALARDHQVLTVAMQSGNAAEIAAYLDAQGLGFAVHVDEHGEMAAQWGVTGLPTSFVIDGRGRVRHVTAGFTTGLGLRLRLWLARA